MRARFDLMERKAARAFTLAQVRRVGTQLSVMTRLCSTPDHTWIMLVRYCVSLVLSTADATETLIWIVFRRDRVIVTSESIIRMMRQNSCRNEMFVRYGQL